MDKPGEQEINALIDIMSDRANDGDERYPGMSYEDGVRDALTWVLCGEDKPQ